MSFVLRDVTIKLITLYFLPESVIKSCNERPCVWKLAKSVLMSDDGEGINVSKIDHGGGKIGGKEARVLCIRTNKLLGKWRGREGR